MIELSHVIVQRVVELISGSLVHSVSVSPRGSVHPVVLSQSLLGHQQEIHRPGERDDHNDQIEFQQSNRLLQR